MLSENLHFKAQKSSFLIGLKRACPSIFPRDSNYLKRLFLMINRRFRQHGHVKRNSPWLAVFSQNFTVINGQQQSLDASRSFSFALCHGSQVNLHQFWNELQGEAAKYDLLGPIEGQQLIADRVHQLRMTSALRQNGKNSHRDLMVCLMR